MPVTPKLEQFLAEPRPTPFLVVDLDVVAQRYRQLVDALPGVRVYYAVKANPAPEIIDLLTRLGSAFDVAGPSEIDLCLAAGARPGDLSFGNTVKKARDIDYAVAHGVGRYTVDSRAELDKVIAHAPGADICVRLFHDGGGADWPLSRKFGCSERDAVALLATAADAGCATGLSFHVGSQQRRPDAWDELLALAGSLCRQLERRGARPSFLNLGGGFPGRYTDHVPPVQEYGEAIRASLWRHFGNDVPELMAEPGRYLSADAGVLRTEVILVSDRDLDDRRWVYIDCGKFNGLAETMDEAIRYRLRSSRDGGPTTAAVLAGPTCDSADVLYDKTDCQLPVGLREGDTLDLLSAGAYTTTYASSRFNGMAAPTEHYI
jgi:ornithine decarboxylase